MNREIKIHVGEGFDAVSRRVIAAWERAERGQAVSEHHLTFVSWNALSNVMTPKRFELLRYLRRYPAASIAALARDLARDYKRVHEDVAALAAAGLIERDARGLHVDYSEIRTVISVA